MISLQGESVQRQIKGTIYYASQDAQRKGFHKEGRTINTNVYYSLVEIEKDFVELNFDSTGTNYVHVSLEE